MKQLNMLRHVSIECRTGGMEGGHLISFGNTESDDSLHVVQAPFLGLVLDGLLPKMDEILTTEESRLGPGKREKIKTDLCVCEIAGADSYKYRSAFAKTGLGPMGVVVSGYIRNMEALRDEVTENGAIVVDRNNPAELIPKLMLKSEGTPKPIQKLEGSKNIDNVLDFFALALKKIKGKFAALLMIENNIFAARDYHGMEPLSLYYDGHRTVFASESCAFPLGVDFKDVKPGRIVWVEDGEIREKKFRKPEEKRCFHESVCGTKANSMVYGQSVSLFRRALGRKLAELFAQDFTGYSAVPVPDSALDIGDGFSEESSMPSKRAFRRTHYLRFGGRRFGTSKLEVDKAMVTDRMVVIEDSINHGDTGSDASHQLRSAGVKSLYMLSATPPRTPCPYRAPTKNKFLRERFGSNRDMAEKMGLDGLYCLGVEDMLSCVKNPGKYCTECFGSK